MTARIMKALALAVLLCVAPAAAADVLRILDDDRDAVQARIDLIQQAESEINALYFLARNDRITLTALALLREAQRNGVRSRVLVDANFQHIPKAVLAHLADEGVEVRVYHPFTLRHPTWLYRRMHEKVVIADGKRYITGGRNLAESYFGMAKRNYVDRDVYVDGPSASAADRHFETLWTSEHVARLDVHVTQRQRRKAAAALDETLRQLRCGGGFAKLDTGTDWSAGRKSIDSVGFLADPVRDGPRIGLLLGALLETAQRSIVIESPYLIPSRQVLELLEAKVKEGVRVQIVTNSIHSTDGVLPFAGYLKYRRRLLRAGIDVREYKGPHTLHAKSAVIDDHIVLIGSYNLDPRSLNLNAEAMCVADDAELARELLDSIAAHADESWIAGRRRTAAPRVGRTKTVKVWTIRLLMPFIEGQL